MEKRVSYLISTKNRAEFLARSIANIREFITPEDELIIMDGGSTDSTLNVIANNKDIVSDYRSEADYGEAHGYNKGILLSKGKFIKFITDDDYFYPDAMHHAIETLETHPELDAIQCGGEAYTIDLQTGELILSFYEYLPKGSRLTDIQNVFKYVPCGLGLFLTRSAIAKAGLFDISFRMADIDYISKLITSKSNFKYFNIKLYKHFAYEHSNQNSQWDSSRDRARIKLRLSDWMFLMDSPQKTVENVLGITNLPGGQSLVMYIFILEKLRGKAPKLFILLGNFVGIMFQAIYFLKHLISNLFDNICKNDSKRINLIPQSSEPEWDLSLRD